MESIWSAAVSLPHFAPLEGDAETKVLIIGGGLAGILCAYGLRQAGVDCLLLEAGEVGGGVTRNTTAKITSQHGLIYDKLIGRFGLERARLYLQANEEALARYRELCRNIDCDFREQDHFVYSRSRRDKLRREVTALKLIGFPAELVRSPDLPIAVEGAVRFPRQAQFHPLKFLAAILPGLRVHEHTRVLELAPGLATTPRGAVRAESVIVTTHFPLLNKHGSYFLKQYQHRSYVLALEGAPEFGGMYLDEAADGLSFRQAGELLLLGGGGHRTGKKGGGWETLSAFAQNHWPQAREVRRWAAQDCMTLDGVPYIGRYSRSVRGLYVATGFNTWGMTSAMAASMILTDLILGRENSFAPVFSPSRSMLRPQLAANAWEAAVSLLTPTAPRCPHMGCALRYNRAEHTWDCPCHGSRFTREGQLLDGPATGGLRR